MPLNKPEQSRHRPPSLWSRWLAPALSRSAMAIFGVRSRDWLAWPLVLAAGVLAGQILSSQPQMQDDMGEQSLPIRVLPAGEQRLTTPEAALAELATVAPRDSVTTQRVAGAFWVLAQMPLRSPLLRESEVLVFGSRHVRAIELWPLDASGRLLGPPIGNADAPGDAGAAASNAVTRMPNGFALHLAALPVRPSAVLARVHSVGSATLSTSHEGAGAFERRLRLAERNAGLLAGAFATLALFAGVVAVHARSRATALFVPYLLASWAMTAMTLGHDYLVFEEWPAQWIDVLTKKLVCAMYLATSVMLLVVVFRKPLVRTRRARRMQRLLTASKALVVVAVAAPVTVFLPLFYVLSAVAVVMACEAVVRVMRHTPDTYVRWFGAALLAQFGSIFAEGLYLAGVLPRVPGLSFEIGALVGACLIGAALAERLGQERRRREHEQARAEAAALHYQHVYEAAPGGMLRFDAEGGLMEVNRRAAQWLSIAPPARPDFAALFGVKAAERVEQARAEGQHTVSFEVEVQGAPSKGDPRAARSQRGGRGVTLAVEAVIDRSGSCEVAMSDVTARVMLTETMREMTVRDALTGLMNRRGLEARFARLQDMARANVPVALLHVDLERFKLINAVFGHAAGDSVLRETAARLKAAVPPNAAVARLGADEFAVVLPGQPLAQARAIAAGIVAAIAKPRMQSGNKSFALAASVGAVELGVDMAAKDALAFADRACRQARSMGRNQVVACGAQDGSLAAYQEEVRLADALRSGEIEPDLVLYAQPLVPLNGRGRGALEILLRVRDPSGRDLAPARLLAAAEGSGEAATIDRIVLARTLEHLSRHAEHAAALDFVAVNLSGASLNDTGFLGDAQLLLDAHPVAARRLCLEITESVALYDVDNTAHFIDAMAARGVRVALDDFGAGYTSFRYLKDLRAQFVKIDGAFVRDLTVEPKHRVLTQTITRLAHEFGMQAIAEWVEDAATAEALTAMGADYGQGWHYAPARPLAHWLTNPLPVAAPAEAGRVVSIDAARGQTTMRST